MGWAWPCASWYIEASLSASTFNCARKGNVVYGFFRSWCPWIWENVQPHSPSCVNVHRISFRTSQSGVRVVLVRQCSLVVHVIGGASSMSWCDTSCQIDQSCDVEGCHCNPSDSSSSSMTLSLTVLTRLMLSLVTSHFQSGLESQYSISRFTNRNIESVP